MHSGGPDRPGPNRPDHQIKRERDTFGYFLGVGHDEFCRVGRGIDTFWRFYGCIERGLDIFWGSAVMNCAALKGGLTFFGDFTALAGRPHAPGGLLGL